MTSSTKVVINELHFTSCSDTCVFIKNKLWKLCRYLCLQWYLSWATIRLCIVSILQSLNGVGNNGVGVFCIFGDWGWQRWYGFWVDKKKLRFMSIPLVTMVWTSSVFHVFGSVTMGFGLHKAYLIPPSFTKSCVFFKYYYWRPPTLTGRLKAITMAEVV